MTLQEFTRDVVPIIGVIVASIGLLLIWLQIKAAAKSITLTSESLSQASDSLKQTSNWNKITSTYNFFDLERNTRIEQDLYKAGEKLGIKFNKQLSTEEMKKLIGDSECFLKAKEFLNDFESYCSAYQVGALDKELAFEMLGTRITKEFRVFYPFVEHLRTRFGDMGILIELEQTANEWSAKLDAENQAVQKAISDAVKGANIGVKEVNNL